MLILPPGVGTHAILKQEKGRIAAGGVIFRIAYVYPVANLLGILIVVVSLEDLLVLKMSLQTNPLTNLYTCSPKETSF
jgi:hypothetical protein